jgi:uncharacterized protein related to proFAR isomerase
MQKEKKEISIEEAQAKLEETLKQKISVYENKLRELLAEMEKELLILDIHMIARNSGNSFHLNIVPKR